MTTFTMQDLNNGIATPEEEEALTAMAKLGAGIAQPITKEEWMAHGMSNPLSASVTDEKTLNWVKAKLDAPDPQPTPDLDSIINTICTQLQLLSTVIRGERAQGATPPEGNQSLQETIALTLQQADWFKEMVEKAVDDLDMVDIAKEAVEGVVESEVEHYFNYKFSPEDHFDFGDAVENAVDDRLDDIVREKIDECIEDVVTEKLSEASVSISF
jgi:hypothetical protein